MSRSIFLPALEQDGYALVPDAITAEAVAKLCRVVQRLQAEEGALQHGGAVYAVGTCSNARRKCALWQSPEPC